MTTLAIKDGGGATQNLPSFTQGSTQAVGNALVDPLSFNAASVSPFHNADNTAIGAGGNAILTGGVAQLLNVLGNLDRQRSTGSDNAPALGIPAGSAQFAQAFLTTDSTDNFAASSSGTITGASNANPIVITSTAHGLSNGNQVFVSGVLGNLGANGFFTIGNVTANTFTLTGSLGVGQGAYTSGGTWQLCRTFTPALMKGTTQGSSWSIQVGGVLVLDTGGVQEAVYVLGVTSTTFTCITAQAHNGTVTAFLVAGIVFNQERDVSGELDGGIGTGFASAVEMEYNGGGPGNANYDRERNFNGLFRTQVNITSGGGTASTSMVVSSAVGISPGMPLRLSGSGTPETVYVRKDYVSGTTIPLNSAIVTGTQTVAEFSSYAVNGPGINPFLPYGEGLEVIGLVDPTGGTNGQPQLRAAREASATNLALKSANGAVTTNPPGQWSVFSTPAAATQATASQAAGAAGVRNVCQSISATVATIGTAQAVALILNLRDGATGAGTILWSKQVALPTNGLWEVNLSGLNIPGTAATAMTLEFAAAGVAASFCSVAMTGTTSA